MQNTKNTPIWRYMEAKRTYFFLLYLASLPLCVLFLIFKSNPISAHTQTQTHPQCLTLTSCFLSLERYSQATAPFFRVCEWIWVPTESMVPSPCAFIPSASGASAAFLIPWHKEQRVPCELIFHSHVSATVPLTAVPLTTVLIFLSSRCPVRIVPTFSLKTAAKNKCREGGRGMLKAHEPHQR